MAKYLAVAQFTSIACNVARRSKRRIENAIIILAISVDSPDQFLRHSMRRAHILGAGV